ncbi:oxidoreductase [Aureobasidium subglaciale]|nr:oxidoreductase [Aureobasidium subglaciale]KAI5213707.1 oxidoreductase [Aureobasidium subglaciale]KAI5215543.1 oxidoreductase [Aureobasidium subglaciale]KAI5253358.1 oxidoreductase [Aureobasidium subglaciale]
MPHIITLKERRGKPGYVYYPLQLSLVPKPSPTHKQLLIRIQAAALNHRDLFIRQHLYPDISFKAPLLCDGAGIVEEMGPDCTSDVLGQNVILTPCRGWKTNPHGPEDWSNFSTIGGVGPDHTLGTAQTYVLVNEDEVEVSPPHLSAAESACLPAAGLTAWRALVVKSGNAEPGRNLLITGIGGGVALQILQFAVAMGSNVYVTSSSQDKIDKAKQLGALGGVIYKDEDWNKQLEMMLPSSRPYIDAVIDGAGGDIVVRSVPILKPGGVISSYVMDWPMQAVLKNIELKGSTLGSRAEFTNMVNFVKEKQIKPVISKIVKGLENLEAIEGLFQELKTSKQFGKLVVEV